MHRSETRVLITHVGSLPRPAPLRDLLVQQDRGQSIDTAALAREIDAATRRAIDKQLEVGVDVGNDGEQPRPGFSTYVARRMRGFGGESRRALARDVIDFPDYAAMLEGRRRSAARIANAPQAVADVEYAELAEAARECEFLLRYTEAHPTKFVERFMTAASPGVIATILLSAYYDSHERYVMALAREMRKEYELIHSSGLLLQVDCPDLAMERARFFQQEPLERFLQMVELHIEAINRATAGIPPERIRLHVCWGNYDGPHTHDVPLEAILPLLYRARVGALSLPLANPRHQHEYRVLRRYPLPDSMLLLPGVIDTTTNYVEHPEVVADRIRQAIDAAGDRTRVLASTDCGFGTFAGSEMVADSVVWAKLRALKEGAAIATGRLWGGGARRAHLGGDRLTTRDPLAPAIVAELLRSAMATLRGELTALPESVLAFHPARGEWCVKEVIGHLIESERRGFAGRIRILLAEDAPRLQTWDQNEVARARRDCERDGHALLGELARLRDDSVALVHGLRREDLERAGEHPKVGRLRVADLLQEWVHHDRNHVKQILANVQAYVWPQMGNAQKFSLD